MMFDEVVYLGSPTMEVTASLKLSVLMSSHKRVRAQPSLLSLTMLIIWSLTTGSPNIGTELNMASWVP